MAKTAAARPNGTVAMMMTALTKLSNCAASTRSTTRSAKPKVISDAARRLVQRLRLAEDSGSPMSGGRLWRERLQVVHARGADR